MHCQCIACVTRKSLEMSSVCQVRYELDKQTWVFFICTNDLCCFCPEHTKAILEKRVSPKTWGYKWLRQDVVFVTHVWSHTGRHSLAAAVPLWQPCWLHSLAHGCCYSNWCWSAECWASCPGTAVEDAVTYLQQEQRNEIKEQLLSLWNPEHGHAESWVHLF